MRPTGERDPAYEIEYDLSQTTTKTVYYIIVNGQRQQVATDIVPSITTDVVTIRYIIQPDNSRVTIPAGSPLPEDKHTLIEIYLVINGQQQLFSVEESIPSETSITIIR